MFVDKFIEKPELVGQCHRPIAALVLARRFRIYNVNARIRTSLCKLPVGFNQEILCATVYNYRLSGGFEAVDVVQVGILDNE